jgi:hypothetical protein
MATLRRALGAGGAPDASARAELRALAAQFPGALRELDRLTTDEIDRRARVCADGPDEPWMAWMARYHELMRAALALRRGAHGDDTATVDDAFAVAITRPRHGRLNVVVFARLSVEFATPARDIWDTLFPRRGQVARRYRE